jgi:hypothetical protein
LAGRTPWEALGELGERVGVQELRDLAGSLEFLEFLGRERRWPEREEFLIADLKGHRRRTMASSMAGLKGTVDSSMGNWTA